jgi:hypothetical protein
MMKNQGQGSKTAEGPKAAMTVTLVNLDVEEAVRIPLAEIMEMADEAFRPAGVEPGSEAPLEMIYAALGRPTGTEILQTPAPTTTALELVSTEPGDYVTENLVTARGLRRLKVQRLGRAPRAAVYADQARAAGARWVECLGWADPEKGLHTLLILWK